MSSGRDLIHRDNPDDDSQNQTQDLSGSLASIKNSQLPQALRKFAALSALARKQNESNDIKLPEIINDKLLKYTANNNGGPGLIRAVLKDESMIKAIIATQVFESREELAAVLKAVAFGDANSDTIKASRQLADTVDAAFEDSPVRAVIAEFLLDRRVGSNEFMELADEILRKQDADLADNLERFLDYDPEIQQQAFQWLFTRMVEYAEEALTNPENASRPLVHARIIFKQINRVLSKTDDAKWHDLQTHIIMRFAERMADEHRSESKPLMSALMAFEHELSRDLVLATEKNYSRICPMFRLRDQEESGKHSTLVEKYGGFECYAQGIETILSFSSMVWPDWTYNYLEPKMERATPLMRAQYLSVMKYALHHYDESGICTGFYDDRLQFSLKQIEELSDERYPFLVSRLNSVLDFAPAMASNHLIAEECILFLEQDDFYQSLSTEKRSFYVEFLLRSSIDGPIAGGRARVLPFIMYEVNQDENTDNLSKAFYADYFNADLLNTLSAKEAKNLRHRCIEDNITFFKTDVLKDKTIAVMNHFGLDTLKEGFEAFEQLEKTNYVKAIGALTFASHAAAVYDAGTEAEGQRAYSQILLNLTKRSCQASSYKQGQIAEYYSHRKRLGNAHMLLVGNDEQLKSITSTASAFNAKVSHLDQERRELEGEKEDIESKRRNEQLAQEEDARYLTEIREEIRSRSWKERFLFASPPEGQLPVSQLRQNLKAARGDIAVDATARAKDRKRLREIVARLKEMQPEMEKAQYEQTKMTQSLDAAQERTKKLNEMVERAQSGIDTLIAVIDSERSETDNLHVALRRMFTSPTLNDEAVSVVDRSLAEARIDGAKENDQGQKPLLDGHIIMSRISLALDERFHDPEKLQTLLSHLATYLRLDQMKKGIFQAEVQDEMSQILTLLTEEKLVPQSTNDHIYQTVVHGLTTYRHLVDPTSEIARVSMRLAVAQKDHARVKKEVIDATERKLKGGTANWAPPLRDFLRLKFPPPEGATTSDEEEILLITFAITLMFKGTEEAIGNLYYSLSGQGGAYFAKPLPTDVAPVNRAEQLDREYARYFHSLHSLAATTRSCELETYRLEEGTGWNMHTNNISVEYLGHLFNMEKTPEPLRRHTEVSLVGQVLQPWTLEDLKQEEATEKDEKQATLEDEQWLQEVMTEELGKPDATQELQPYKDLEKRKKTVLRKLSFSTYAFFKGAYDYVRNARPITLKNVAPGANDRIVGYHDAGTLSAFAYWYSRKIIVGANSFHSDNLRYALKTLEHLDNVIDSRLSVHEEDQPVKIKALIGEALSKVRHYLHLEVSTDYDKLKLPRRISDYALPDYRSGNADDDLELEAPDSNDFAN